MPIRYPCLVLLMLCGLFQLTHLNGQESSESSTSVNQLSSEQIAAGWIQLFDGETLFGWKPASKVNWKVQDDQIVADRGEQGLLRTTSQFDDFELTLEFQCDSNTNSGVFFRTSPRPRDPALDCYEFNIAPADNPFPTGSLVGRKKGQATFKSAGPDAWTKIHLVVRGGTIQATVGDDVEFSYQDPSPLGRGYIGLQFNQGRIAFRNVFLRPLSLKPMVDPELSQWNTRLAGDSRFQWIDPETIRVLGGKGQIESKRSYADFVFSMRCRTHEVGLNSGVFFRCIPGDPMNGYESQIQNESIDNDPTQPLDCGTGGIFRRTTARKIVAQDKQWFTKTIIATGPHISVWVNGYQVTDWSDTRKPHPNPRKGTRLKAGTLILQGHDPTTRVDFSELRIRELSARWNAQR